MLVTDELAAIKFSSSLKRSILQKVRRQASVGAGRSAIEWIGPNRQRVGQQLLRSKSRHTIPFRCSFGHHVIPFSLFSPAL